MPITSKRFITADEFKGWDEIDPILSQGQTYQDTYINQALTRASRMINKFANKQGKNYLFKNWDTDKITQEVKEQIQIATCFQAQFYLINTPYYENTDSNQSQGSINFHQEADDRYFLVPEVVDILISLDLAYNFVSNDMNKHLGRDNKCGGRWNPCTGEFDPLLSVSEADARYIQKRRELISTDHSIHINANPGLDTAIDIGVNTQNIKVGPPGPQGVGVNSANVDTTQIPDGQQVSFIFTKTDDTETKTAPITIYDGKEGPQGKPGADGKPGQTGKDGASIVSANAKGVQLDDTTDIVFGFEKSDGTNITTNTVSVPNGKNGAPGPKGKEISNIITTSKDQGATTDIGFTFQFNDGSVSSEKHATVQNGKDATPPNLATINGSRLDNGGDIKVQAPLIAGDNITITGNTISSTSGDAYWEELTGDLQPIGDQGLYMKSHSIKGMANGTGALDAVNKSQLDEKQVKIKLVANSQPGGSGDTNADLDANGNLRVWDPQFESSKLLKDYRIAESEVANPSNLDTDLPTTKYITKFYPTKTELADAQLWTASGTTLSPKNTSSAVIKNRNISIYGSFISGLPDVATLANEATSKKYVDGKEITTASISSQDIGDNVVSVFSFTKQNGETIITNGLNVPKGKDGNNGAQGVGISSVEGNYNDVGVSTIVNLDFNKTDGTKSEVIFQVPNGLSNGWTDITSKATINSSDNSFITINEGKNLNGIISLLVVCENTASPANPLYFSTEISMVGWPEDDEDALVRGNASVFYSAGVARYTISSQRTYYSTILSFADNKEKMNVKKIYKVYYQNISGGNIWAKTKLL